MAIYRRNAGAPKRRAASTKMRASAPFKKGQKAAARVTKGRRLSGTQKEIRQQIHELIRQKGTAEEKKLLAGPIGAGKAPHSFRKGLASYAAELAGFNPSRSSSRAGAVVQKEFARDRKDQKKARKGRGRRKDVSSMSWGEMRKAAGKKYKVGMTKEEVIAILGTKSNPGRSRRARGARGKVSFYDLY